MKVTSLSCLLSLLAAAGAAAAAAPPALLLRPAQVWTAGEPLHAGEDIPLQLIETRTFGSRVIYERYGRALGNASG